MKTRLHIAAVAALVLSLAPACAAVAVSADLTAPAGVLVAVCDDGGDWAVAAPASSSPAEVFLAQALFAAMDASGAFPEACAFLLAPPLDPAVVAQPGDLLAQDAAVWSRQGPVVRDAVIP